ncbi:6-phospho-3-hexuloisomerase [Propionispora vibrioides]|jgi:6-phospho-3-hexuloisomerase|uniref:6-phospho-3-hexuloisomerase n=2 Tax=Propionispora vibrioides TaxID=112903 RepID=A0A1H8W442_9FIRM|nr:6-phospho-3-hexuloisomerase [Propionispora vibrioides]
MSYRETYQTILEECETALGKVKEDDVKQFIELLLEAEKVFFIGVGRVKLAVEAFAKRLAHLGIATYIVGQITEPAMTDKDMLVVASGSGESLVPVAIARKAKQIGGKVVHLGSNPQSSLAPITDLMVRIPVQTKLYLADEIQSQQPMSSLFEQTLLLLGDTIAKMIVEKEQIELKSLWQFHANLE